MQLTIENRSKWPTWFVDPVCRWICRRAGIKGKYKIVLPSYSRTTGYCGRGNATRQRSRINRRFLPTGGWPYMTKYWRYKWSPSYAIRNRLEAFVDIVAHEAWHATGGNRSKWRGGSGRIDRARMEMSCERFAAEAVEAFRAAWPTTLRPKCAAAARAERQKASTRKTRRSDPTPKLAHAETLLRRWESKAKLAKTKIAKYRRQVKYYEQRLAARPAEPKSR